MELSAAVLASALDGIVMIDGTGRIIEFNPAAETTFGYARSEALGRELAELLIPERFRDLHRRGLANAVAGNRGRVLDQRLELVALRRDGGEFPVELTVTRSGDDPPVFTGFLRDVSERVRMAGERAQLREELEEAQRLESLGQLAGGIAHEFNNLLAIILAYAELLRDGLPEGQQKDEAEEITAAALRAGRLTRQLLMSADRHVAPRETVDLNATIRGAVDACGAAAGDGVEVDAELDVACGAVEVGAGQLEEAVIELVGNAREAMPDGGRILIRTSVVRPGDAKWADGLSHAPHALVEVADTGIGMPPEIAAHAADPFFTTKPKSSGTGLGLTTARAIARGAHGELRMETEHHSGTTVRLYIPEADPERASAASDGPAPSVAEPSTAEGGGERILLVEDNPGVRAVAERILTGHGYEVVALDGPEAALAFADDHAGAPPDLLLTDVVMPGISGLELGKLLGNRFPGLGILFMSGYAHDVILDEEVGGHRARLVTKPFTVESLLAEVAAALRERRHLAG
jgi:PAS domain S-box-containing protein